MFTDFGAQCRYYLYRLGASEKFFLHGAFATVSVSRKHISKFLRARTKQCAEAQHKAVRAVIFM